MIWLVLDVNYLAYRAHYSTGHLEHNDLATGVTFGVLRDVLNLMQEHDTKLVAFCFDYGRPKRAQMFHGYKQSRRSRDEEDQELLSNIRGQVDELRSTLLHDLGFRNVFAQKHFEADDLIASVCSNLPDGHKAIIVSSDHDLFQLLNENVMQWIPSKKRMVTHTSMTQEYGVGPSQWVDVKAIAGCNTDNIPGVQGVGEKTACRFLSGKLGRNTKAFANIVNNNALWQHNLKLVRLPLPGTMDVRLRKDQIDKDAWNKIVTARGMKTLRRV